MRLFVTLRAPLIMAGAFALSCGAVAALGRTPLEAMHGARQAEPLPLASPAAYWPQRSRRQHSWLAPGAPFQKPLFYVTFGAGINIYEGRGRNPAMVGELTDGLQGTYDVFVDRQGTVYVTNWEGPHPNVVVYPAGATQPSLTIQQGLHRPLYVIADDHGHVFVSDGNTGNVVAYLPGSSTPERVLRTHGVEADGMAFSPSGDLYVAYRSDSTGDGIDVFRGGRNPAQDIGIQLNAPQGLLIDPAGNILVAETQGTDRVDLFPPGATSPAQTWPVPDTPTGLAFDRRSNAIFVSCLSGNVFRLPYPGTRQRKWITLDGGSQAMAYAPVAHR